MACGRLSSYRKLDQRLRVERNFSFHNCFFPYPFLEVEIQE
jgi:hypothetical protein